MNEKKYDYLKAFNNLINKFEALNMTTNIKEPNLFSVGARGHFENPTTELLAFFLDPANHHELGDCFFKGLQSSVTKNNGLSFGYVQSVQTEVITANNKRIDLLIETDSTLIVIECKIYSDLYNPLDDYSGYCNELIALRSQDAESDSKPLELIKLVLCPEGTVNEQVEKLGWDGISYNQLVEAIETQLSASLLNNPYNKWAFFAREFLLHLKGLNIMTDIKNEEIDFLNDELKHYSEISQYIYEDLMPRIGTRISTDLLNSNLQNFDLKEKYAKWNYYEPVRRFFNINWNNGSEIIICLRATDNEVSHEIKIFLSNQTKELIDSFIELLNTDSIEVGNKSYYKQNDPYYTMSWEYKKLNLDEASTMIVKLMSALNNLELNYRPKLV